MLARCSAAFRSAGPPPASRRSLALWSLEPEKPVIANLRVKRGRPRIYDGRAQPVHPDNTPLVRLLQKSDPIEGTSMAQHTYAINTVACYPKPITSMDDVKQLRVGDTYKTQIALYVRERTQRELDPVTAFRNSAKLSAKTRSLQETLAKLPYISVPLSKKLTAAGCQSLDDLAKDSAVRERLTVQPRKMVPWVDHILQPVTREEAQRFEDLLNEYLQPSGWLVHMTGEW
ncbi:hypothetical protein PHLGIDRAFT_372535 [Phlebiopsis gigantea 11061_1 CR5-6]|uniref:Uncharacterized protein n=1 Tax=Phlebiopsis gigantea (strain 11061_1 CR5-6) TaxID=745531 RepID=A0A0C3S0T7_PHLG1|nr:hypothetical protein PHLGIDRAFT_372535 [Phlebiopsis gigantea 11061_1 CR5-6]